MNNYAVGTPFAGTIDYKGGIIFPDIVANNFYGVEVKTTTQNHWKTTGNSVLESTRVKGVEKIFILFGKLAAPTEFKWKPYEECLSEVVVTHSPRYLVDMNLPEDQTIFRKMQIEYDVLRKQDNPISYIVQYYKDQLKEGEDLWWINQSDDKPSNFIIRTWNSISKKDQENLRIKGFTCFPEIYSNNSNKYGRFAIWLTKQGIVCPNVRDVFTAGGQESIIFKGIKLTLPKVLINLLNDIELVRNCIEKSSAVELRSFWQFDTNEESKLNDWLRIVAIEASTLKGMKSVDIKSILAASLRL